MDYLSVLNAAAQRGCERIENGDVYRDEITDAEFVEIVSSKDENAVIEEMVASEKWWRAAAGFNRRPIRQGIDRSKGGT